MSRLVIIESPLAATSEEETARHLRYGMSCMRHAISLGESPIAFHLLYPAVLDDTDRNQRELGMGLASAWYRRADAAILYVDHGVSPGMIRGALWGQANKLPVEIRSVLGEGCRLACTSMHPVVLTAKPCELAHGHEGFHASTREGRVFFW